MKVLPSDILEVLFDESDYTCFSGNPRPIKKLVNGVHKEFNSYGNKVFPVTKPPYWAVFYSLNALDPKRDNHPDEEWHSEFTPRRAEHNVIKLRTFLIEIDKGSNGREIDKATQLKILRATGIPFAGFIDSGRVSIHAPISLEEPLQTKEEWLRLMQRTANLVDAVAGGAVCDRSMNKASGLARYPGGIRCDKKTGGRPVCQELLEVGRRCSLRSLEELFEYNGILEIKQRRILEPLRCSNGDISTKILLLPGDVRKTLIEGVEPGKSRHQAVMRCLYTFAEVGMTLDEALNTIKPLTLKWFRDEEYDDQELRRNLRNAYKILK